MRYDKELSKVMKRVITAVMVFVCAAAGYQFSSLVLREGWQSSITAAHPIATSGFIVLASALCGLALAPLFWWALVKFGRFFESRIQNVSAAELIASITGLLLGLLLANLIAIPLSKIPGGFGVYISVLLNVALGYWGLRFFSKRSEDLWGIVSNMNLRSKLSRAKKKDYGASASGDETEVQTESVLCTPKVLDTSAIIDGRILDVAREGFLEGTIILPRFVLTELQAVADSQDPRRRARGRRGLFSVAEMQKTEGLTIEIPEITLKELGRNTVDEALVVLAKRLGGKVVTTDYNLNQVANIEGVEVLNVNDLSNALKPKLLPGEKVEIDIIRLGKDNHQGIGYLDDGTMFVVEDGARYVGEKMKVTVTSVLQTSSGRMIFGRVHP